MSFGLSDIKIIVEFIKSIKDKFFSGINWQNESLRHDIFLYLKEFKQEIKSVDKNVKLNTEGIGLLGQAYFELEKLDLLSFEDIDIEKFNNSYLEKCFRNYMKKGKYKSIFSELEIKIKSYLSTVREYIENYGEKDGKKLVKERNLFDKCIDKNLIELKKGYIDFMIICLSRNKVDSEMRDSLVGMWVDKIDFEKYVPIIKNLFDKIDNRVLVE